MRIRVIGVGLAAAIVGALVFAPIAGAEPSETASNGAAQHVLHTNGNPNGDAGKPGGGGRPGGGGGGAVPQNGIDYHGGPVMTAGVNAYVIWYGNWANNTAKTILPTLLGGLGGSPYFNINTTYVNRALQKVPNTVHFAGQTDDAYSQGAKNLSDAQIGTIVASAITSGALPNDPNGVYFVLTSVDVTKSGFLTSYCGWHTHGTVGGSDVKYAFVGDPGTNGACSMQTSVSPNSNVGADAMASVVAHELEESATDPDLSAWWDKRGMENADKCAWTFGTESTLANGSKANMTLGGLNFLIQRNWVNANGGYCATSY